jgi:hypothetical protein
MFTGSFTQRRIHVSGYANVRLLQPFPERNIPDIAMNAKPFFSCYLFFTCRQDDAVFAGKIPAGCQESIDFTAARLFIRRISADLDTCDYLSVAVENKIDFLMLCILPDSEIASEPGSTRGSLISPSPYEHLNHSDRCFVHGIYNTIFSDPDPIFFWTGGS